MVGIDIVEVSRVVNIKNKDAWIDKCLTKNEIAYLDKKSKQAKNKYSEYDYSLAGVWATKEAVLKAFGIGIIRNLKQIEVLHQQSGAPFVKLDIEFCKKYGIDTNINPQISISHDGGYAICVCFCNR